MTDDMPKQPFEIMKWLLECVDSAGLSKEERANLDIVIDIHWFFLHSKFHKENYNYKKHIGKWKYDAPSGDKLFHAVKELIPAVARKVLPVVKFTNTGNVLTGERLIVAYCFPFGPEPLEVRNVLLGKGLDIYWGSTYFKPPPQE